MISDDPKISQLSMSALSSRCCEREFYRAIFAMFSQKDASKTTAEALKCPENHSACQSEYFEGAFF